VALTIVPTHDQGRSQSAQSSGFIFGVYYWLKRISLCDAKDDRRLRFHGTTILPKNGSMRRSSTVQRSSTATIPAKRYILASL
jgi:hypothetical protein